MQQKHGKNGLFRLSRHEWLYRLTLVTAVMMVPLVIGVGFSLIPSAHSADSRGAPLLLTPGQNALTYFVMPERTLAPLQAGTYWAQLNLGLGRER
jgi:hypothetical protein